MSAHSKVEKEDVLDCKQQQQKKKKKKVCANCSATFYANDNDDQQEWEEEEGEEEEEIVSNTSTAASSLLSRSPEEDFTSNTEDDDEEEEENENESSSLLVKPNRYPTAYMLFTKAFFEQYRTDHPEEVIDKAAFGQLASIRAAQWAAMTEAEKAPYTAASAVAKARYEEHMVAYKAQQLALAAPKKPLTSYMTFAVAERPKVLQEMQKTAGAGHRAGSKVGVVEVATELGRRWAALPTAVKKAYEMTAARARKEYAAALAEQEAAEEEEEDEEGEEGDEDDGGGQEEDTENEGETDNDSTAAAAADDDDESASEFVESTVEESYSCNENDENEDYEEEDAGQEKEEDVLAYCSRFVRRRRRRGSFSPSYSYSSGESFDSFDGDEFEEEGGEVKTGQ